MIPATTAIKIASRAISCRRTCCNSVRTTVPFYRRVMHNAWYRRGDVSTNFIRRRMSEDNG